MQKNTVKLIDILSAPPQGHRETPDRQRAAAAARPGLRPQARRARLHPKRSRGKRQRHAEAAGRAAPAGRVLRAEVHHAGAAQVQVPPPGKAVTMVTLLPPQSL